MKQWFASLFILMFAALPVAADNNSSKTTVLVNTNQGQIKVALDSEKAPRTVKNFLQYVEEKFYDATIFHRVIENFMIQGGGFTKRYRRKPTHPPIRNEANNGLKNVRGSISMARTSDPDSATAQFFINVKDNKSLDHKDTSTNGWGYTVFGHVIEGMDIVDKIRNTTTGAGGPFVGDVPLEPIIINSIRVLPDARFPASKQTNNSQGE
ncbi:MAG: peptidyl-prolyl cis-trans isomerase [Methylococcales bacterium]|jgi:peptidyl-prolyl cis-trans isomerase B (cyclophilin B)|nr:peptidyl-prolyl cis-trans isomerase [Methylococcales bacterium]